MNVERELFQLVSWGQRKYTDNETFPTFRSQASGRTTPAVSSAAPCHPCSRMRARSPDNSTGASASSATLSPASWASQVSQAQSVKCSVCNRSAIWSEFLFNPGELRTRRWCPDKEEKTKSGQMKREFWRINEPRITRVIKPTNNNDGHSDESTSLKPFWISVRRFRSRKKDVEEVDEKDEPQKN